MFRAKHGTFSEGLVINYKFAIPIPDEIPTHLAGPLMCAGTTVFAPFRNLNIKPGQHVGVVGLGGLGHLAIRFAKAFGCEVTAFSRGTSKEADAKKFGSHHYINTTAPLTEQVSSLLDYILITASGPSVDYGALLTCLKFNGKLVIIGATGAEIKVPLFALLVGQKSITGSAAGSFGLTSDMLEFAALHKVFPDVEVFSQNQFNEAIEKVKEGKVRFRAVVKFD